MAQIVFPPNPNVGDTVTGEYGEVYTWDGQKWTITPGAGGGVAIEMGEDPPTDPIPGNLWWSTGVSKLYLWDGLQWVVAVNTPEGGGGGGSSGSTVPIAFVWSGPVPDNGSIMVPVAIPLTIPANLEGSQALAMTPPLGGNLMVFTLEYVPAGLQPGVTLGTISFESGANYATFAGAGGSVNPGDTFWLRAPSPADMTLGTVGITILATRA